MRAKQKNLDGQKPSNAQKVLLFICFYFTSVFFELCLKNSMEYFVIAAKSKPITTRKQNG